VYDSLRDTLFQRRLEYACSFDPMLRSEGVLTESNGLTLLLRGVERRDSGPLFHVADAATVLGADGRAHDCPVGIIVSVEQQATFEAESRTGAVSGRATFKTYDDAVIDTTFSGRLRLRRAAKELLSGVGEISGELWLTLSLSTSHSRYQWLNEHACVANGRWNAKLNGEGARHMRVASEVDVYSAR
jgi:uncharacterized protein DUF3237